MLDEKNEQQEQARVASLRKLVVSGWLRAAFDLNDNGTWRDRFVVDRPRQVGGYDATQWNVWDGWNPKRFGGVRLTGHLLFITSDEEFERAVKREIAQLRADWDEQYPELAPEEI